MPSSLRWSSRCSPRKGFDPGPADGMFGARTIDAIAAYQQARGLPVTGQIDTGLVATLRERST